MCFLFQTLSVYMSFSQLIERLLLVSSIPSCLHSFNLLFNRVPWAKKGCTYPIYSWVFQSLFDCLSVNQFINNILIYLSICWSIYITLYISSIIHLSIIYLSIHYPSTYPSIFWVMSGFAFIFVPICWRRKFLWLWLYRALIHK